MFSRAFSNLTCILRRVVHLFAEMSILNFFKPTNALPAAKDTGLSKQAIQEANKAVESVLKEQEEEADETPSSKKRRKYTTTFSPEDRAQIGKFAVKNGNAGAVHKYSVGEITVRLFIRRSTLLPCVPE